MPVLVLKALNIVTACGCGRETDITKRCGNCNTAPLFVIKYEDNDVFEPDLGTA